MEGREQKEKKKKEYIYRWRAIGKDNETYREKGRLIKRGRGRERVGEREIDKERNRE